MNRTIPGNFSLAVELFREYFTVAYGYNFDYEQLRFSLQPEVFAKIEKCIDDGSRWASNVDYYGDKIADILGLLQIYDPFEDNDDDEDFDLD